MCDRLRDAQLFLTGVLAGISAALWIFRYYLADRKRAEMLSEERRAARAAYLGEKE